MSVRHAARRAGAQPLGQHFLRSSRLADDLVRESGAGAVELVLEPGAGTGVLTAALAKVASRVWAIELDAVLVKRLRRTVGRRPGVLVIEADAAELEWPSEPFAVVANLPFNGATRILRSLFASPVTPVTQADVILQWGAAVKYTRVWPSTLLTVYWGAWYELSLTRRLPRSSFAPVPEVDAGVLRAIRRVEPLVAPVDHRRYGAFLRQAFRRRSATAGLLGTRERKRLADELGFRRTAQPRDLDARQWSLVYARARDRP